MVALYPILSLLLVFALATLITRIGAIALEMSGLSPDVAQFQAATAFTGAGYTTDEAEAATETPGRRTIITQLFRLGSLGLVSAIASLVLSFTRSGGDDFLSIVYIVAGSVILFLVARSSWLNSVITPIIKRILNRRTDLEIRDYAQVLGLRDEYRIAEIDADEGDWLTGSPLAELDLPDEGVRVLAIERQDGSYIGAPGSDSEIQSGDTAVFYGQENRLQELSDRDQSDTQAHDDAVEEHDEYVKEQEQSEG